MEIAVEKEIKPAAFYVLQPHKWPTFGKQSIGRHSRKLLARGHKFLKWLDQQQPQSVIYVAFGSTTLLDRTQFQELGMALELSNRPFLLVVRPDITDKINDAYQKGFQDRIATRGHIVSWAPQQKVLAHPSIACFISHCGWNSTMEGISNGVPFLCWPYFGDQMHNENYICNIWRIGLGLSKDESGIITREEIKTKLEELLDNSKYKANVLDLKERVLNSIKEGGSSYNNFKNFVEWLKA
ncbi:UDP-glycosyltransferase 83A1-like [Pistacia vera]|uniref:UDP-glycosyltransferase 83A1-like n=1 Tax=Pistacia vera TaxID=55513 RepID=UPI001263A8FA|nr:UDP-glycosyltransferase 83A1-like [Pistacia vera]